MALEAKDVWDLEYERILETNLCCVRMVVANKKVIRSNTI